MPSPDMDVASESATESEDALTEPSSSESSSSSADDYTVVGKKRSRKAKASKAKAAKKEVPPPALTPPVAAKATSEATPPATSAQKGPPTKVQKGSDKTPPPIYLQDKGKWTDVSAWCTEHHVNFTNARSVQDGIKITVPTVNDFRSLTKMLQERALQYHTFALPEERVLRAVIKNIPQEISTKEILEDLRAQDIPALEVHRMHRAKGLTPFNMVIVVAEKSASSDRRLFNLKSVCRLSGIKIETPRKSGGPGQCHRCQLYGHAQRFCFAKPRCVKCLGDHATADCSRPKDRTQCSEPPSCVLCGEKGHPANYRGCPKAPKTNPKAVKRAVTRAPAPTPIAQTRLSPQRPFAWNKVDHQTAFPALAPKVSGPRPLMTLQVARPPAPAPQRPPSSPSTASAASFQFPPDLQEDLNAANDFVKIFDFGRVQAMVKKMRACKGILQVYAVHLEYRDLLEALEKLNAGH